MIKQSIVQLGRELRRDYPHIPPLEFLALLEKKKDDFSGLIDDLDAAERKAALAAAEEQALIEQARKRVCVSHQHERLSLVLPRGIDLAHVQAILTYGFICPGRKVVYSGSNPISEINVHLNSRNKLTVDFSEEKFGTALEFLIQQGVLYLRGRRTNRAYSLNLDEKSGIATRAGAQIIREAKKLLE